MTSILNNSAALSALQSLQMTQQSLATVENQVSTGLSVASAADNSSYWSIATQLNNDSGIVTAANSAMSEGQSVLATATSAINSVITTLNSMATALTQAQNPGANIGNINTSIASLGQQLTDAVNAASFNGVNVVNGTQNTMSFVAGFNASATGGSVNTISFAAQALTGGAAQPTTTSSTITSPTTIAALKGLTAAAGAPSVGTDQVIFSSSATAPETLTVNSVDAAGNATSTTYAALDANGNAINGNAFPTDANIKGLAVSTTVTPGPTVTTNTSTITDPTGIAQAKAIYAGGAGGAGTYASPSVTLSIAGSTAAGLTVVSQDVSGQTTTSTTYTALDANGNNSITDTGLTFANAASFAVTTTTSTTAASLLTQNGVDLTGGTGATSTFQIGGTTTASQGLAAVNQAIAAVTNYAALIGATQDRMTTATTFNSALTTNYANGVSGLVDADMNTASTRLQALQTQEQLGIQSLSVANQNASLILKLFQ